ncbi:hypothetical protein [Pseudomonas paracarnis]|uniref:hypothetical protein n=1 Tax=Pseudomonas paracarnis TaxID=2750625 RepID=UPI00249C7E3F|nr:hypothetical protein [Pseudomonas paracarnis]MDI3184678.1 hypothetical protein [Pseudomonas paracarnis]
MTDKTELKRLAEAHVQKDIVDPVESKRVMLVEPKTVLALIAENEELGRYLCTCRDCGGEGALHTGDWHSYGHMEPPEPVMEKCGECDGTGLLGEIQDLYQVITERDQLRAEVAGLKTGYEAYERVNAELKAENEALKKRIDDMSPFKGAPLTGPDLKCLACGGYHYGLQGLPCPNMRITASAALGQGEQS